ncbi:TOBE domain-containing protein [Vibrio sp. PP-XX7]
MDRRKENSGQVLVVLALENGSRLLAKITLKSAVDLQLCPGMSVWSQIKSVALS